MRKKACLLLLLAAFAPSLHASDGETLVRFDGAIGVIPVSNVGVNADGTFANVSRNIVRGVNPAGQIWVMAGLNATVRVDGRIRVRGRGLLLGGGNNIGLNGNARVFATLICGAAAPFIAAHHHARRRAARTERRLPHRRCAEPGSGRMSRPRSPDPQRRQPELVRGRYPEVRQRRQGLRRGWVACKTNHRDKRHRIREVLCVSVPLWPVQWCRSEVDSIPARPGSTDWPAAARQYKLSPVASRAFDPCCNRNTTGGSDESVREIRRSVHCGSVWDRRERSLRPSSSS